MADTVTYEPGSPGALDRLPPIHPGEILHEEFMQPGGLTQSGLAAALGISFRRIHDIIHGKRGITAETSILLGRHFGMGDEFFLRLQADYDLKLARKRLAARLGQKTPGKATGAA